jgi:integration host factor subunit beta
MTKSELVEALSDEMDFSTRQASEIVDTILDSMSEALSRGEGVEIRGFGSFSIRQYNSYKGRNPKTGAYIDVKPKRLPFFKVGKELREAVDRNR